MRKQISNVDPRVKKLLERDVTYADDDNRLCCRIWLDELAEKKIDAHELTTYQFFIMLHKDQLTKGDAVTRARRKIEEDFKHLRGHSYNKRHRIKVEEVKVEIKELKYKHNDTG